MFLNHLYVGDVPAFVVVMVNVTGVPAQTGFADGVIITLTGKVSSTVTGNVPYPVAPLYETLTDCGPSVCHVMLME